MEASTSSAPEPSVIARQRGDVLRTLFQRHGLILLLLALPVFYGVKDLKNDGNLSHLANNLFSGLSNGTIIALIAIGYTLVYGIIELINFAHGDVFMIGSFTASQFWSGVLGVSIATGLWGTVGAIIASLLVAMIVCGSLNVLIEKVAYRPLRSAPKLAPLITAVGMSFILQNVGLLWLGGSPLGIADLINAQHPLFHVFGVSVQNGDLLAVAVTVPLLLLMTNFINRSRLGKAMRATAQDPEAARL